MRRSTKNAVSRWERGVVQPSDRYKAQLCLVYNVGSPEELGWDSLPGLLSEIDKLEKRLPSEPPGAIATYVPLEDSLHLHRPFDPSRRATLRRLLTTAATAIAAPQAFAGADLWERLSAGARNPGAMTSDTCRSLGQLLVSCWQLSNHGSLEVADQVLVGVLPQLMDLASRDREAAKLTAHGLRLRSILSAHFLRVSDKIALCQRAVDYARLSGDPSAYTAALTELAVGYKYAQSPMKSLAVYEAALKTCDQASPLLGSRVHAAAAAAYAQAGRAADARRHIRTAYTIFPSAPERDLTYPVADTGMYLVAFYEGVMHLAQGEPGEADRALSEYWKHPSAGQTPDRNKLEIVNQRARTAIHLNDLESYAHHLEHALVGSVSIMSRKRFDEALTTFRQEVPSTWMNEPAIKSLNEQYQLTASNRM